MNGTNSTESGGMSGRLFGILGGFDFLYLALKELVVLTVQGFLGFLNQLDFAVSFFTFLVFLPLCSCLLI